MLLFVVIEILIKDHENPVIFTGNDVLFIFIPARHTHVDITLLFVIFFQKLPLRLIVRKHNIDTAVVSPARTVIWPQQCPEERIHRTVYSDVSAEGQMERTHLRKDAGRTGLCMVLRQGSSIQQLMRVVRQNDRDISLLCSCIKRFPCVHFQVVRLIKQEIIISGKVCLRNLAVSDDVNIFQPLVNDDVSAAKRPGMHEQHPLLSGQLQTQIQQEQRFSRTCDTGDADNRGVFAGTAFLQIGQDPPPEIKLLVGEKISALEKIFRRRDGRDQIIRRLEEGIDPILKIISQRLFLQNIYQIREITFLKVALLI